MLPQCKGCVQPKVPGPCPEPQSAQCHAAWAHGDASREDEAKGDVGFGAFVCSVERSLIAATNGHAGPGSGNPRTRPRPLGHLLPNVATPRRRGFCGYFDPPPLLPGHPPPSPLPHPPQVPPGPRIVRTSPV